MDKKSLREILEEAKKCAVEGKWDVIDEEIVPEVIKNYNHEEIVDCLPYLFSDESGDVRDLAATITAKIQILELPEEKLNKVKGLVKAGLKDQHTYARFRSAIVAVKYGIYDEEDKSLISKTLEDVYKSESDREIKKLAFFYMKKIK